MADKIDLELREDTGGHRFEGVADGEVAGYVQYHRLDDAIVLMHTQVSDGFAGRGVGGALARAVLDRLRAEGTPARLYCPFLRGWVDKHPDYADAVTDA